LEGLGRLATFEEFDAFLDRSGPWVAGIDFPFGQPRRLIENLGWPMTWEGYVRHITGMTRTQFVEALTAYRSTRPGGDKQHLRRTDELAGACSPMMLYRVPVGKMFFEGAPRLLRSDASVHPCRPTGDPRVILEAYPAMVARGWIGNRSYKSDTRRVQTPERRSARKEIVRGLLSPAAEARFGFEVQFGNDEANTFIQDGSGDQLDALLCSLQTAWAYTQRHRNYGIPTDADPLEGWIIGDNV
jgi:hypothetical protein